MRILMISAEGPPLARAGALVDVMDALPHALRARGHEVAVALPFYREIRENPEFKEDDTGITVDIRVGENISRAEARAASNYFSSGATIFLIGPSSTANTVCSTKTMPRALFFSAKRPWNWRAA